MRKLIGIACLALGLSFGLAAFSQAQVGLSVSASGKGLDAFHLAIGDYFKVSVQQIQTCQDSQIPDDEQPVVFFLAQRANVSPESVILLRKRGLGWMQIARQLRINPSLFYVQGDYSGTPYENGGRRLRDPKHKVVLNDADIVNFVNLKFASEHYGRETQEIVKMRAGGEAFTAIHKDFSKKKSRVQWETKDEKRPETPRAMGGRGDH